MTSVCTSSKSGSLVVVIGFGVGLVGGGTLVTDGSLAVGSGGRGLGFTGGLASDSRVFSVVASVSSGRPIVGPGLGVGFEISSKRVISSKPGLDGREVVPICG